MSEKIRQAMFPKEVIKIFGISITDSVFSGFLVVVILTIAAIFIRLFAIPKFKSVAGGFQAVIEWLVSTFDKMSKDITGHLSGFLGPYTFGAAAYIFFGVMIEAFGFRAAFADINACIALALTTFLLINTIGIKEKGVGGRIKYYFKPVKFIAPIKLITDAAVPVSLTFRLFGSVLSGMIIMELIYVGIFPIVVPALVLPITTLFHAFIQSYIFSALSLTFIAEAAE